MVECGLQDTRPTLALRNQLHDFGRVLSSDDYSYKDVQFSTLCICIDLFSPTFMKPSYKVLLAACLLLTAIHAFPTLGSSNVSSDFTGASSNDGETFDMLVDGGLRWIAKSNPYLVVWYISAKTLSGTGSKRAKDFLKISIVVQDYGNKEYYRTESIKAGDHFMWAPTTRVDQPTEAQLDEYSHWAWWRSGLKLQNVLDNVRNKGFPDNTFVKIDVFEPTRSPFARISSEVVFALYEGHSPGSMCIIDGSISNQILRFPTLANRIDTTLGSTIPATVDGIKIF